MKKAKASKNKAAAVERRPNVINLDEMSSEDLVLFVDKQWQLLRQAENNIMAARRSIEQRKAKTDE